MKKVELEKLVKELENRIKILELENQFLKESQRIKYVPYPITSPFYPEPRRWWEDPWTVCESGTC